MNIIKTEGHPTFLIEHSRNVGRVFEVQNKGGKIVRRSEEFLNLVIFLTFEQLDFSNGHIVFSSPEH